MTGIHRWPAALAATARQRLARWVLSRAARLCPARWVLSRAARHAPGGRREYIPVGSIAASLRRRPPGTCLAARLDTLCDFFLNGHKSLRLLTLACLLSCATPGWAKSGNTPIVHLQLQPQGAVELGTELELQVEVLVPTWFLDAPHFPQTFELPGTTSELLGGSAESLSATIDGEVWAGLRRRYHIRPLNPGEYHLPELAVAIRYADPADRKPLTQTVHGRLRTPIRVTVPTAAATLDPFIAATRLQLLQRIELPQGSPAVGDAVRRTIVLETDTNLVELPASIWAGQPGLRLYLDPPRSRETRADAAARAVLHYERAATWVFERAGSYELPAVRLAWWDLHSRRVRVAELPAVPLRAGSQQRPALFALPTVATATDRMPLRPTILTLGAAATLWLGWRWRALASRLLRMLKGWWGALLASRWWLFQRLLRACRRNDARAAHDALQRWLDACASPAPGLQQWLLARAPSAELVRALAELDATLFAATAPARWRGAGLARQLLRARRRLARQRAAKTATLPATLNP